MVDRDEEVLALIDRLKKGTTNTKDIEDVMEQRKHVVGQRNQKFNRKLHICNALIKRVKKQTMKVKYRGNKPNCWHYTRGHCKRGKYCDFKHDIKNIYPNSRKVFLGGLPFNIKAASLKQQLFEQGYNVVNKPKVYGGFSPQVCLATAAEATKLITGGSIKIGGLNVDVRAYEPFTKKSLEKREDVCTRSVFLGGLRKGTTTTMIKKELQLLDFNVVNNPVAKEGFSPQVTMATAEQAKKLVGMVKVQINGTYVDIRPYTCAGRHD
jgi:hypothetical protein